jgi:ribosomal protein S18 acetylase RimI-like enzyme
VGPWHDQADVAHVVLSTEAILAPDAVRDCVERARDAGYADIVTSPMSPAAATPFLDQGFDCREELALLVRRLDGIAPRTRAEPALRRAGRADRAAVLDLDRRAFPVAWQLGASGLHEALRATPAVRFRVARASGDALPAGYAVTGRAGRHGYLQRLAVDPGRRRQGLGTRLVADALRWLRRGGARRCMVNTQTDNGDALALYDACGFRRLPAGLAVLGCSL